MSAKGNPEDELTEKIKILATDDKKIKSFGEILTNDSSREILQLLFNEELTAARISQRTGISLQLVRYHLNKLRDLGVVRISRIEKNSKSQDMKVYSATKFSIVIVPPKLSEKTKESKLLVRSFRHIYKVVGLGISTGLAGLLSLSALQQNRQLPTHDTGRTSPSPVDGPFMAPGEPARDFGDEIAMSPESAKSPGAEIAMSGESAKEPGDEAMMYDESAKAPGAEIAMSDEYAGEFEDAGTAMSKESERAAVSAPAAEPQDSINPGLDVEDFSEPDAGLFAESAGGMLAGYDLFLPLVAITMVLGGLTLYYLCRSLGRSQTKAS